MRSIRLVINRFGRSPAIKPSQKLVHNNFTSRQHEVKRTFSTSRIALSMTHQKHLIEKELQEKTVERLKHNKVDTPENRTTLLYAAHKLHQWRTVTPELLDLFCQHTSIAGALVNCLHDLEYVFETDNNRVLNDLFKKSEHVHQINSGLFFLKQAKLLNPKNRELMELLLANPEDAGGLGLAIGIVSKLPGGFKKYLEDLKVNPPKAEEIADTFWNQHVANCRFNYMRKLLLVPPPQPTENAKSTNASTAPINSQAEEWGRVTLTS